VTKRYHHNWNWTSASEFRQRHILMALRGLQPV
jgi:hypothetical protein